MAAINYTNLIIKSCMEELPRANLGARWCSTDNETRFVQVFATAYDRKYAWLHGGSTKLNRIMAREVPVNGFGIADLVTVSWEEPFMERTSYDRIAQMRPTVRSFEFKLSDWRRGLMQAHRYRFFADASILVLPAAKLTVAVPFLCTFRNLNVGLWGFDEATEVISMAFTPRPGRPAESKHREKAIARVVNAANC